jgi:hypothetical protein
MSTIAKYDPNTGEIKSIINVPQNEWVLYEPYVECEQTLQHDLYYVENGVLVQRDSAPSGYHTFDFTTKQWIVTSIDLDLAKLDKKKLISDKVNQLRYSTIVYDGKNLDANEIAQTNISGKIAQLQNELALALPSNDLFWKDADNIVHTWTDPAVYLEWLQGLQVQIASRATLLYNTAWTGKAAIDAFTDINDVMNYDINALFGIV